MVSLCHWLGHFTAFPLKLMINSFFLFLFFSVTLKNADVLHIWLFFLFFKIGKNAEFLIAAHCARKLTTAIAGTKKKTEVAIVPKQIRFGVFQ